MVFQVHHIFQAHLSRTPTDKTGGRDNDAFRRSGAALDPFCVMADRTVGNTIEQAIPFLTTLWLHAIFVDARVSTVLGALCTYLQFFMWDLAKWLPNFARNFAVTSVFLTVHPVLGRFGGF